MTSDFIKHKVRPQDTLTSLAARIGMDREKLRQFHNQNCGKLYKIYFDNLLDIEYIFIPTLFLSEEARRTRNEKKLPAKTYALGFHAPKYLVSETFQDANGVLLNFNYSVNLNIKSHEAGYIAETSLADFRKDGVVPDDKISSLALACMGNIYPISFKLLEKGTLEHCVNHKNVIQSFNNGKAEIEDFFIGEVSKKYVDLFFNNLSNESYFFQQLKSGFLYQILFPNLEWFYQYSNFTRAFYIYNNSFPLQFNFRTEHIFDSSDFVETKIIGTLNENCTLRELLKGIRIEDEDVENQIGVEIEVSYLTHKNTKQLHELKSHIIIWDQEEIFQKHQLHLST